MEEEDLRRHPLEYFIPKMHLENKEEFVLGETAGTTGLPKVTAYLKGEFYIAFVEWFRYIAAKEDSRAAQIGYGWVPAVLTLLVRPLDRLQEIWEAGTHFPLIWIPGGVKNL